MRKLFYIAAFFSLAAFTAAADDLRHPELQKFEQQGGKVESLGHALGLDGWLLINKDGTPSYAYTTAEGGLVVGMLVGPDGKVTTRDQLLAYQEKLKGEQSPAGGTKNKAEEFYAAVEKTNWIKVGAEDAPPLYMFVNVSCSHCQEFWKDLQAPIKEGKVQVRLVPAGEKPENREGGAALLSVNDPVTAWNNYISGQIEVLSGEKATKESLQKIDTNTALLKDWNVMHMPFTIYRRVSDGTVMTVMGKVDNAMLVMADLIKPETGVEKQ